MKRYTPCFSFKPFFPFLSSLLFLCKIQIEWILFLIFKVEVRLGELKSMETKDDLLNSFQQYGNDLMLLAKLTGLRQAVSSPFFTLKLPDSDKL